MILSIVIPAYNEENRILRTLVSYSNFFNNKFKKNAEIIVIVNGSSDNTVSVVSEFAKHHEIIRVYEYKVRIGKGGAIINGFRKCKGHLVGFVDADMATVPEEFYKLIDKIGNYDGIIASRYHKQSIISKKQPFLRVIASRGFNVLVRLLFGLKFRDTQCGAKLFKREAINSVIDDLGFTQYSFDIDLLYRLKVKKFRIIDIPTVWNDQENSKLILRKTIPNMFLSVIRLRLIYSRFRFLVNIYDSIGAGYFRT